MLTKDQHLSSMLHGEALLRARRTELDPLITEQRELAAGRDDIRGVGRHRCRFVVRFAGHRLRHELIAAGLLLVSGPVDRDLLLHGFGLVTSAAGALGWDMAFPTDLAFDSADLRAEEIVAQILLAAGVATE
jgi:hypothetical protein